MKRIYIDMDGVLADFDGAMRRLYPNGADEFAADKCQRIAGFYYSLEPIEGAVDAACQLSRNYDVYILSTASWDNPHSWAEKARWVADYMSSYFKKRLILSHNKGLLKGDYLIDDRDHEFDGMHLKFGSKDWPDWASVMNFFKPETEDAK